MGLDPGKHLGKEIAFLEPYLHKLKEYVKSCSISNFLSVSLLKLYAHSAMYFLQFVWDKCLWRGRGI